MSVQGISFASKRENFVLDYQDENFKTETGNKNSTVQVKMKDKFLISKMRKKPITTIIIIFGLMCTVTIFIYLFTLYGRSGYCHTNLCHRSAENLLSSMDTSVDPCDDFYQFACGKWAHNHPIPEYFFGFDWFEEKQITILKNISDFLQKNNSDDEPIIIHQARTFYRSCLKASEKEKDEFEPIKKLLSEVNLPLLPPYSESSTNFSWLQTAILSKRIFNQDFFIQFAISPDPKNNTLNKLHISKPSRESPLPVHPYFKKISRYNIKTRSNESEEENKYSQENEEYDLDEPDNTNLQNYIANVSQYVFNNSADFEGIDDVLFNESVNNLLKFQNVLDGLIDLYYKNESSIPQHISITELQELTDNISAKYDKPSIIDWKEYFEITFYIVENITLDFNQTDSILLVSDMLYIENVFHLLANSSSEVIEFYMWWIVVSTIIPYVNNAQLNQYRYEYQSSFIEIQRKPKKVHCSQIVHELLLPVTGYAIIHDAVIKENMIKISEMVDDIKFSFLQNIENIEWMDQETKAATIKKINSMKKRIGIPELLKYPDEFNEYFEDVIVSETDFLGNILNQVQQNFKKILKDYRVLNNYNEEEMWIFNPLEVNAFNFIEANSITIPAGLLQFPFYGQDIQALNYGSIGSIIGHEITHNFDNTGKEFDASGNVNPWWTEKTITEFHSRAHCFVNYYENITFPEGTNSRVNGLKTLDENIADNGGVRIALLAYRNYLQKYGAESLLHELKMYSAEKLFFLAFANTWCENSSKKSKIMSLDDEHSPNSVRVLATLINSKEFSQTWQCKLGSRMNPEINKCRIW